MSSFIYFSICETYCTLSPIPLCFECFFANPIASSAERYSRLFPAFRPADRLKWGRASDRRRSGCCARQAKRSAWLKRARCFPSAGYFQQKKSLIAASGFVLKNAFHPKAGRRGYSFTPLPAFTLRKISYAKRPVRPIPWKRTLLPRIPMLNPTEL